MCIYLFLLSILILIIINYFTNNLFIKESSVHGKGLFTNKDIKKNEIILLDVWPYGNKKDLKNDFFNEIVHEIKYLNHCKKNSNCEINLINNKYLLVANKDIKSNNEILIDYDKLNKKYNFIGGSKPYYKKC